MNIEYSYDIMKMTRRMGRNRRTVHSAFWELKSTGDICILIISLPFVDLKIFYQRNYFICVSNLSFVSRRLLINKRLEKIRQSKFEIKIVTLKLLFVLKKLIKIDIN